MQCIHSKCTSAWQGRGGDKGEVTLKNSNRCEGANERYKNDIKSCSSIPHKLNVNIFIRHNDKNNDAPFNGLCSWECEQIPQTHFPTHSRSVWWKVVTGIYLPIIIATATIGTSLERVYTPHLIGPNFMYAQVSNTSLCPLSQVDHEVVILRISFT